MKRSAARRAVRKPKAEKNWWVDDEGGVLTTSVVGFDASKEGIKSARRLAWWLLAWCLWAEQERKRK